MSFMRPEIAKGDWFIVETEQGGTVVPADLALVLNEEDWPKLLPYVDGEEIESVERKHAFGARLFAPGYIDHTDWTLHDTQEDAEEHLRNEMRPDAVELWFCADCTVLAVNGCIDGATEHQDKASAEGLERLSKDGTVAIDNCGHGRNEFSSYRCDCCEGLPGSRTRFTILEED